MFYSHTILARKGPLGTVWFAVHLQHRLKKSHYAATDIPSTVDRIMFPEVPIALRMSGHLLLGVVRIYSKKVEYLHHDCNLLLNGLRKAFASIDLNLPQNAMQAPLQSITLPETFCLDDLDFGGDFDYDGAHNDHLGNQEDITLTEQFPIATDPFVAITFDEDILMEDLPHQVDDFGPNVTPMDTDTLHPHPEQETQPLNLTEEQIIHIEELDLLGSERTSAAPSPSGEERRLSGDLRGQDPGPSQLKEVLDLSHGDYSVPENVLETEVLRDAPSDTSSETLLFSSSNMSTEPHDPPANEKTVLSPVMERSLHSPGPSPPFQPSSGTPASVASLSEGQQDFNTSGSVAIRSTPRIEQPPIEQTIIEQPRPRKRKKQYFDDPVVLSNKFIGKRLRDASDISRKRKHIPSSTLGIWKLNNVLKKDQVFLQPSVTGLCSDLSNIYNKAYISTKSHLFEEALPDSRPTSPSPTTEVFLEERVVVSPHPPSPPSPTDDFPEKGVEGSVPANEASPRRSQSPTSPEQFLRVEHEQFLHVEHEGVLPSSPRNTTPAPSPKIGSASVPSVETNTGTRILQTPDLLVSAGHSESENGTPRTMSAKGIHPESMTAEAEDLWFLEAEDRTPSGSQGVEGVDSLSVRTRAVAQYLKSHSPEDQSSDLSLNKILEGKRRKLSARMFFETLVLKSYNLIDVKQEVPYGDISLKLTQSLSKAQF